MDLIARSLLPCSARSQKQVAARRNGLLNKTQLHKPSHLRALRKVSPKMLERCHRKAKGDTLFSTHVTRHSNHAELEVFPETSGAKRGGPGFLREGQWTSKIDREINHGGNGTLVRECLLVVRNEQDFLQCELRFQFTRIGVFCASGKSDGCFRRRRW